MHTFDPVPGWRVLTERDHDPNPPKLAPDDPGTPLEFTLTPRERDIAIAGQLELEIKRRKQNREDEARAAKLLLEGGWEP